MKVKFKTQPVVGLIKTMDIEYFTFFAGTDITAEQMAESCPSFSVRLKFDGEEHHFFQLYGKQIQFYAPEPDYVDQLIHKHKYTALIEFYLDYEDREVKLYEEEFKVQIRINYEEGKIISEVEKDDEAVACTVDC